MKVNIGLKTHVLNVKICKSGQMDKWRYKIRKIFFPSLLNNQVHGIDTAIKSLVFIGNI